MVPFQINVVLVRSIYDSNVGASSRAMANMGGHRLILIDPKCEITLKAHQAAATGQAALENRTVYSSWDEFYLKEAEGVRLAFTSKNGQIRHVRDYEEVLALIENQAIAGHYGFNQDLEKSAIECANSPHVLQVYLIFGPEDAGLSNHDLSLTHFNVCIPTFGDNVSLNLAQAVLLALFQLRLIWGGARTELEGRAIPRKTETEFIAEPAPSGTISFPENALRGFLEEMGLFSQGKGVSAFTVLKRMLLHSVPNKKELSVLETVLQQGIRKLKEYNKLRSQAGLPFIQTERVPASENP